MVLFRLIDHASQVVVGPVQQGFPMGFGLFVGMVGKDSDVLGNLEAIVNCKNRRGGTYLIDQADTEQRRDTEWSRPG